MQSMYIASGSQIETELPLTQTNQNQKKEH